MPKYYPLTNLKIAIFYDWLTVWGGAERLLLSILKIYPRAQLFTTFYDPQKTKWLPKGINIKYINYFPKFFQNKQAILAPLMPVLLERYNFDKYDILFSIGTIYPHCLLTKPHTKHICYLLTPNRYLYSPKTKIPAIFKSFDSIYMHRPDHILTTSKTVSARIKNTYNLDSHIIYPGIDTKYFFPKTGDRANKEYFLCVSRLVPYKKIDLAIHACGQLNLPLQIVGDGRQLSYLKTQAKNYQNIQFLGLVSDSKLRELYQNCRALISPQYEDFGLSNLEVQSCGKPVIAYNAGGNQETIVSGQTGLFFNQQSILSLKHAIKNFNSKHFSAKSCRKQALKFNQSKFMLNLSRTINEFAKRSPTTN